MTVIDTPEGIQKYRAIVCKSALKLFKVGMSPGRGWTKTRTLEMASGFTGKKYKRDQLDLAITDMTELVSKLVTGA